MQGTCPRPAAQDAQEVGNFTTANSHRASVICITLLRASPVVSPSFDTSQLQNEAPIPWFFPPATQGACFCPLMGLYFLLPPPLSWSFLSCSSPNPLPPTAVHAGPLYRHLVHIGDCHCHLLIITVTCTLRGAINTWRYQWRAMAPQRLFRLRQSWWERESW